MNFSADFLQKGCVHTAKMVPLKLFRRDLSVDASLGILTVRVGEKTALKFILGGGVSSYHPGVIVLHATMVGSCDQRPQQAGSFFLLIGKTFLHLLKNRNFGLLLRVSEVFSKLSQDFLNILLLPGMLFV